jgi:hypothetical protein
MFCTVRFEFTPKKHSTFATKQKKIKNSFKHPKNFGHNLERLLYYSFAYAVILFIACASLPNQLRRVKVC